MTPSPIQAILLIASTLRSLPGLAGAHQGYTKKQTAGTSPATMQLWIFSSAL
jgi:hypothetical protein